MKRTLAVLLILVMLSSLCCISASAEQAGPDRLIHVVYDDSGSMYIRSDTWCRAKYSMEVFAAMLGGNDRMNIYYMSNYENGTSAGPRIQLNGADGIEANVEKVHNQTTTARNTPFDSVRKACSDLEDATADEKWLVVITDGAFEDGALSQEEIDDFFAAKASDVQVMFFSIGEDAANITENPSENIFCSHAETSKQILKQVTEICTRIFNTNRLDVDANALKCSFDVPMSRLTVFAQGADVKITGIRNSDGELIKSAGKSVEVKYSKCDATNYSNAPVKDLLGKVAVFEDDFSAGDYTIEVTGADTVEVYYKPNIAVAAYLTDSNGNEIDNLSALRAGEYTIHFGLVKAGTSESVPASSLLGTVTYEAAVTVDGSLLGSDYTDGSSINLPEGSVNVDVTARYLEYNTVTTSLTAQMFNDKQIQFTIKESPEFDVITSGFARDTAVKIKATIDGKDLTQEQWIAMSVPQVELLDSDRDFDIQLSALEKTDEPGVFALKPEFPDGKPSYGTYSDVQFSLIYQQKMGEETWSGEMDGTVKMKDSRSWWEQNRDKVIRLAICGLLLLLLLGYTPLLKNYLPKSLKKRPYIQCIPSEPGEQRRDRNGSVEKNILSTIIPFVPQKGIISYVPRGVTGCPKMAVKAIKGQRMKITNIRAFAGKEHITLDGEVIKKDVQRFETGAGISIRVSRNEWTYVCTPNQTKLK